MTEKKSSKRDQLTLSLELLSSLPRLQVEPRIIAQDGCQKPELPKHSPLQQAESKELPSASGQ